MMANSYSLVSVMSTRKISDFEIRIANLCNPNPQSAIRNPKSSTGFPREPKVDRLTNANKETDHGAEQFDRLQMMLSY